MSSVWILESRPAGRLTPGRIFRLAVGWLLLVLALPLGAFGAVLAFLGTALLTSAVPLLVLSGLLVCLLIVAGLSRLAFKAIAPARRARLSWTAAGATTLLLAAVAGLVFFRPLAQPQPPLPLPAGAAYWDLPTGSHIAYLKVPAQGTHRDTPIIRLHGGPGAYAVAATFYTPLYRALAREGFDVYIYDQIGGGLSARLPDIREYTLARHVADLEAIRQQIGAERLILQGESWGGTLAAAYMAAHPDRVEKVIFASPGPISEAEWRDLPTQQLPPEQQRAADSIEGNPRFMALYFLLQVNPQAAHNFAPDSEMDAFFDEWTARMIPAVVCDPSTYKTEDLPQGFGFWANMMTGSDATMHDQDQRAALANNHTPALILKGECDYIKWEVTYQYKATLPNSTLLYIPGAGHAIYMDQPELMLSAERAFLLDQPLPLEPYTGSEPPTR